MKNRQYFNEHHRARFGIFSYYKVRFIQQHKQFQNSGQTNIPLCLNMEKTLTWRKHQHGENINNKVAETSFFLIEYLFLK